MEELVRRLLQGLPSEVAVVRVLVNCSDRVPAPLQELFVLTPAGLNPLPPELTPDMVAVCRSCRRSAVAAAVAQTLAALALAALL